MSRRRKKSRKVTPKSVPIDYTPGVCGKVPRCTKVQAEIRKAEIYEWLVEGKLHKEIIDLGVSKWGVRPSAVQKYIQQASERYIEDIRTAQKQDTAELVEIALECYKANMLNLPFGVPGGDRRVQLQAASGVINFAQAKAKLDPPRIENPYESLDALEASVYEDDLEDSDDNNHSIE